MPTTPSILPSSAGQSNPQATEVPIRATNCALNLNWQLRRGTHCARSIFMADDPRKNPTEQSDQPQKQGQYPDQTQKDQQDMSKRNPSRQDQNKEQDDQQQCGQRLAS